MSASAISDSQNGLGTVYAVIGTYDPAVLVCVAFCDIIVMRKCTNDRGQLMKDILEVHDLIKSQAAKNHIHQDI